MKFLKNLFKSSGEKIEKQVEVPPAALEEEIVEEEPEPLPDEIIISWIETKEIFNIRKNVEKMSNDLKELIYSLEQRKSMTFSAIKEASIKRAELIENLREKSGITASGEDYQYAPAQGPNTPSKFIKKKRNK